MLVDQSVRGRFLFLLRTGDSLYFILSTININKNPRFVYKNKAGVLCEGKSDAIGYTGLRGGAIFEGQRIFLKLRGASLLCCAAPYLLNP